ncbi:serine/threonine protein kinase [Leptothoe kymatousa]|uniref:non-specific serine/threonine protein kinase n=1 Tax=Leptothoe kymatousa TAU-MAC 1615 TaxID=2364775 RepID=A0ABS5Y377_9CYAN|nr:serine/threonine-protein kinase [Leptothoe kymatousa]MBT9312275.1 serine/threonine protein kinase [Leptothoe kymatousa TAU-MAC 1615]
MATPSALQQTPLQLCDRYSIQQTLGIRLGRRTLLGYDHSQKQQIVIKYLCFDDPIQPVDIKRFHQEILVLKRLNHGSIPAYLDSFEIHEHGYNGLMLVQAYVPGQSFYSLINSHRSFTEHEVREIAHQVLQILDYLHQQQPVVIHRDIKPSSLVLSPVPGNPLGKVYLVDFGLVQSAGATQTVADEPIMISGTPGYRPSEQLGDRAVPATDLYSLGATLIHIATGQHPSSLPQRGVRILFSQELGHMSRPIKAWLRWLTQPKQHKRPQSAQSALHGLEQADQIFAPSNRLFLSSVTHRWQRALVESMAPTDTQLKIFEYSQTLEVVFPPLGWKNRRFGLALLQTVGALISLVMVGQGLLLLWPHLLLWQRLMAAVVSVGWLGWMGWWSLRGLGRMGNALFQQISIQLLPDIILLGKRFPHRPVTYQVNAYKRDIVDIDMQPGSSTITFWLRRNRTDVGRLDYALWGPSLGVKQSEMRWVNDILQLWLRQSVSRRGAV